MQLTPYIWVLAISAGITGSVSVHAWRHRTIPGAAPFAITMDFASFWCITNAFEMVDPTIPGKLFWANLQYLSYAAIPVTWLATVLQFTGNDQLLTRRRIATLCIVPAITVILVWTNDFHGLMRGNVYLDTSGGFPVVGKTYGAWFWVHATYSYLLLLASLPPLVVMIFRTPRAYIGQPLALLIGMMLPYLGDMVYVLGLSPTRPFDPTPVLLGVSGLVVTWSLFRHRLFDIVPLARDRVFEAINDAVIVLDAKGKIVDLNRAARAFLHNSTSDVTRMEAGQVLGIWPELLDLSQRSSPGRVELTLGEDGTRRHYEAQVSPLTDGAGRLASRVISLHDITERKWVQAQWLQQQRTLAILEARERLEREIAEALHSHVQSKLMVAWHRLGECERMLGTDPDRVLAILAETRVLIDEIKDRDIEQVSHRLHPAILSLGLVPALRTLAESFEEHFEVAIQIDPRVIEVDSPLEDNIPEFMRLAVYRVLEEALNNVRHHAMAGSVDITVGVDDRQRLTLLVRDDGCGFDPTHVKRGLGLSGIAGRVEEIGGVLRITSSKGQGSTISAVFPSFDLWGMQ